MCTLTIVPRDDGYLLGMNRDERVARGAASWPRKAVAGPTEVLYPLDVAGGTWIAVNEHRMAFALLNWNDVFLHGVHLPATRSRGFVIPEVIRSSSLEQVQSLLRNLRLDGTRPFRLMGVFPDDRQIREWRWDTTRLYSQRHAWERRHWFSSSLSDQRAQALRGGVCEHAWTQEGAGSLVWLRRLHASHANGPGPFSICVHREDVRTLSYTEVVCNADVAHVNYIPGSPCLRWAEGIQCALNARTALSPPNANALERAYSI